MNVKVFDDQDSKKQGKAKSFEEEGFLGPFDLKSAKRLVALHKATNAAVITSKNKVKKKLTQWLKQPSTRNVLTQKRAHLESKLVYDLATESQILDDVENLLGPNILLWIAEVIWALPA